MLEGIQTLHDISSSHYFCINAYELCLKAARIITLNYAPQKGLSDKNNMFIKKTSQESLWMELCGLAVNLRMLDDEHKSINEYQSFKRLRLEEFKCGNIIFTKYQQLSIKIAVDNGLFSNDFSEEDKRRIYFNLTRGFVKNKKERRELDLRVACNKIIHSTGFKMKKNKIIVESEEEKRGSGKYFYEESVAEINIIQFVNEIIDFLMPDMEIYKEKAANLYPKQESGNKN